MVKSKQTWQTRSNIKQLQRPNAETGQLIFFSNSRSKKKKIRLVIQLKLFKTATVIIFFQSLNAKRRFIMFGLQLCSLILFTLRCQCPFSTLLLLR